MKKRFHRSFGLKQHFSVIIHYFLLCALLLVLAGTATAQDGPLSLSMTATPDPVRPSGQITYTLTVTNQGETDLSGVVLQNTVPGNVEPLDPDGAEFTCSGSSFTCYPGETMTWKLGELPAGQSRSGTFGAVVEEGSDAPTENTVITSSGTATADEVGGGAASESVLASTETYRIDEEVDGRFITSTDENNSTYTVTVQLRASPGETDVGTSTVRFTYDDAALRYDSGSFANYDGSTTSFTGGTVTYNSTITEPGSGEIALNIEKQSSTDGNGQALTNEWTDVATLTFDILDQSATSNLEWPTQDIYNRLGESDGQYHRGTFAGENAKLPVELAAFEATSDGENVLLTWQTTSETNNAGFQVQHKQMQHRGTSDAKENS